ncbi:MAG: hypothetical protein ABFC38_08025 [Methanospirillum sp.]
MSEKEGRPVCEVCGREAIGIQSLGCCATTVCAEHAEPALRDAKPGETVVGDACCFLRFEAPPAGEERR